MKSIMSIPEGYPNDWRYCYEGFWACDDSKPDTDNDMPWPVKAEAKMLGLDRFLSRLDHIQNKLRINLDLKSYMDESICRLCDQDNGSDEYWLTINAGTCEEKVWIWPEGYMHYLTVHNVHPTNAFYNVVMKYGDDKNKREKYNRTKYRKGSKRNKKKYDKERANKYAI